MERDQINFLGKLWYALKNILHSLRVTLRIMSYNKIGFAGFLFVVFILLVSFVGPSFVKLDTKTKVDQIYRPPSLEYPLGTDHQGRDVLSQIVNGGRDVIQTAAIAAVLSTLIAVTFGTLAGFLGGWVDSAVTSVADIVLTIPQFPLLAVLAALINFRSLVFLGVLLGFLNWPALLRAVRAQALSLKERDYVEAARSLDLGTSHIIFREIVPNMMPYIIISFTLAMTGAVYQQVGLVLLGLIPISGSNWGVMISLAWTRGAIFFKDSVWYIMAPVLAIALFQMAVITMGRSLELVFNPRLRSDA
jgi:peptide/nickel transport system permease protein